MKFITSAQNPWVKYVIQLQEKSKLRKKENLFVAEGLREIDLAVKGNFTIHTLIVLKENFNQSTMALLVQKASECIIVNSDVYKKLAYRDSTEGVMALIQSKNHDLDQLDLRENSLLLVMENIEKPGNVGAMLRTADAVGANAVILANPLCDLYNPNVVRSSVGTIFTNQIAIADSQSAKNYLLANQFHIYSAILQDSEPYESKTFTGNVALVVGSEANGLSALWRREPCQNIHIPMYGKIDSMNVSVAAAILLFEIRRQKNLNIKN